MKFFDAHNHLQAPELAPHLAEIVAGREAAQMVVNGMDESDWPVVAALAKSYSWVRPSYGVHPWRVDDVTPAWREMLGEYLEAGGFVGEIGLDRGMTDANFELQREMFREQWREGARREVPITVHCVLAWGALAEEVRTLPPAKFLIHAYGGPAEMVGEFAERGAYFSFSGYFLGAARAKKREPFLEMPPDRLLVETDAPSLPLPAEFERKSLPESAVGERVNHPDNLIAAYEGLAGLRGMPLGELADVVAENFERLFGV